MNQHDNLLFHEGDLRGTLDNHVRQISNKVNAIPKDQFLSTPEEDLVDCLYSELYVAPLTLHEDAMVMEQHDVQIEAAGFRSKHATGHYQPILVHGVRIEVSLPFTGEAILWRLRPHHFQLSFPRAVVQETGDDQADYIEMVFEQPSDLSIEQLKQNFERELKSIRFYVDAQREQIEQFNQTAPESILREVRDRKERLEKHDGIVERLEIPLKRRDEAPSIQPIEIERTLACPFPPTPESIYQPEPGFSDDDFHHILSVIRYEGHMFEATPNTYAAHDEEELRDVILAHLNGHFQGSDTGDIFLANGETGILIEADNRAAFIAECIVWCGQEALLRAVDQLLAVPVWRDCKASMLIFNKQKVTFTELLEKVPETVRSHPNFKRDLEQGREGEWRFIFTSQESALRQVTVNFSLFNLSEN